jgi:hypothetical protein
MRKKHIFQAAAALASLLAQLLQVPCAISRPPAMTRIRSAIRSATSRMCVVMITVSPAATLTQDVLDLSRGGGIEAGERLIGALSYALRKALAGLACAVRKAQQVQQSGVMDSAAGGIGCGDRSPGWR